jgi:hypothetical protein
MSLSVGANSNIVDLFKQRRNALQAMESAVQAGSIGDAQQSLAVVQQDTQNIQSLLGDPSGTSRDQAGNSDNNPYRATLKSDLTTLVSSVASGDLPGAQQALLQFQQDTQGFANANTNAGATASTAPPGNGQTGSQGGVIADFKALLLSALSGDVQGAQNAATSLTSDLQNNSAVPGSTTPQAVAATTTPPSTGSSSNNTFLNDLKALIDAAQSGDQNAAQQAAQQVTQDIQNAAGGTSGPSGHHHHHHHHAQGSDGANTNSVPLPGVSTSSPSPIVGSGIITIPGTATTPGTSTSDSQNAIPV